MIRGTALALTAVIALGACVPADTMMQEAYPDRQTFRFKSSEGDVFSYLCATGSTSTETKTRAGKAHSYFDRGMNGIVDRFVEKTIGRDGDVNEAAFEREMKVLEVSSTKLVTETESRFQCLFFDGGE